MAKFDFVEQCTHERQNTKWRFKLITNVTIFSALLKNIAMRFPDSVLPEPLLRHTQVNCLLSNKDKEPFVKQRQRSFVSFPCIGHVHEGTE